VHTLFLLPHGAFPGEERIVSRRSGEAFQGRTALGHSYLRKFSG